MLNSIVKKIRDEVPAGGKIVFVGGNFNIVHPGHLRLLRFAAECGNYLVVGVNSDGSNDGIMIQQQLRLDAVEATSWVDYAFILGESVESFITELTPDIVVKGKEHENTCNSESSIVEAYGGQLIFASGDTTFSSIDLIRSECSYLNQSTIQIPLEYLKRHNISRSDLIDTITQFDGLGVLVIGDLIVDEYVSCDPLGMSQEDPTIVVTPVLTERFIGGAGIVAAHAKGLGGDVDFISIVDHDEPATYAKTELTKHGVKSHLFEDDSRPTTTKRRYRANGKTLLRVNKLKQHDISKELQNKIFAKISELISSKKLLIFSDFNYGVLPQYLIERIRVLCDESGVMMVADSQSSSQVGDVSRFKGMALLTPTEREARLATFDHTSGLVVLAESLRQKADALNIFVTLGKEGVLVHAETNDANKWMTDRIPSMNLFPEDTAGAGDSLLTASSMAMVIGANIWECVLLGSIAAACQVGRIGNIPLKREELTNELLTINP